MNRLIRLVWLSAILLLSSLTVGQASHAFLWTANGGMEDLGTVPGWLDSTGYAINNSGFVAGGDGNDNGDAAAFGWTPNNGMGLLKGLNLTYSGAYAMNRTGQIVGVSQTKNGGHAFLWTRDGGAQDLGTLGGPSSVATGINDSGEVVGYSDTPSGVTHAFLWTQSAGMQDLNALSKKQCPACQAYAFAINNAGVIVGEIGAHINAHMYPFIWKNGSLRNLGVLSGNEENGGGVALGVNDLGQVVGEASTAARDQHAFLWTEAGGMQDLGTLPGCTSSTAQGINTSGQIVGNCEQSDGTERAFIWSSQMGMLDIGTLGGADAGATAINDAGQVTGGASIQ
jgi:probable HAF family extracellular repeat protein